MKLLDHIQRWNKWRKHSMNSRIYKFLVLVGLQHSPTLTMDDLLKGGNDD